MFKLEIDSPTGGKDYLYISNLNNSEKEIYNFCLSKKYDYDKVKELKNKFQNYYSPKNKSKFQRKGSENKTFSTSFSSYQRPISHYEKKSSSLFPFQIFVSQNKNTLLNSYTKNKKIKKYKPIINKTNKSISLDHSFKKDISTPNLLSKSFNYTNFNKELDHFFKNVKGVSEEFKREKNKFNERYTTMNSRIEKYDKSKNYGVLLYNRGMKYLNHSKEKKEQLKDKISQNENYTFLPYLNKPNEDLLKSRIEKNYYYNNNDILTHYDKYKESVKQKDILKIQNDRIKMNKSNDENEEIFEPKINEESKNITLNYNNIFEKLYDDRNIKEKHLQKMKEEKKNIYPFKPKINKPYKLKYPNISIFNKYNYLIKKEKK